MGDTQFHFRIRQCPGRKLIIPAHSDYNRDCPTALQVRPHIQADYWILNALTLNTPSCLLTFYEERFYSGVLHQIEGLEPNYHMMSVFKIGHLTLMPAWMSNYIHYEMWDEITFLFPNFNGCTIEVWEWIHNFIPHFTGHVITYPYWD